MVPCTCHWCAPRPVSAADRTRPCQLAEVADPRERRLLAGTPTGAPSTDFQGATS